MRKLLLFVCALFGFMACTQNPIEEQSAIRTYAPETIRVGFEDNETRIQLNEAQKTVWTKGDQVSVFYKSDANQKYEYRGETGERTAELHKVSAGSSTTKMGYVVVAYPYNEEYIISPATGNLETMLPAVQHYAVDSYGVGDNLMVSCSEFTQFSLKSVCGWLKLQLTGNGEKVKSITLRGNNGEQVAGLIHVDTKSAEATLYSEQVAPDDNGNANGSLIIDGAMVTELTLDCGEGVTLGKSATAFYIALPPQTFEQGFTVEIEDADGYAMEQSTAKTFVVERNTISPMAALEFVTPNRPTKPTPANNEIWYTNGSTTEATTPNKTNVFGANIVSNTYDAEKECWVIKFDGEVTTIGDGAFIYCESFTSVTIPNSVTTIGYAAFAYCSSLTSVTIPDSVTTIGNFAFAYCSSLTSVTIPDSVTTIGNYAFEYCSSLTSVTIPDSVTTIGYEAFRSCGSLTSVTIPDSVITIEYRAFGYCSSLTSVTIPDSVTTIGDGAFVGCSSLQEFNGKFASEDGRCLIIDGTLNAFAPVGLTEYTIPDSVTTIGYYAFSYCSSLTSVTIPDSVTEIGNQAFVYCSSLQEFNGKFASEDGRCLIIDDTLNSFAPAGLTEYIISNSVTEIGDYAFYSCISLTSVTIPDSLTEIGYAAFAYCSSLTSVTIPDSVTTIENYAFENCSSLTSVTIGDSVTTIECGAFYGCSSLTSVYCKATTPPAGDSDMFYNNAYGRKIYVPMDSVGAYKSAEYWSEYASDIVGYNFENGVVVTPKPANNEIWYTATAKAEPTFDDFLTFGSDVVSNVWDSETKRGIITFDGDVTMIGDDAFNNCDKFTGITLPESVTSIGKKAFYDCDGLTEFIIPDSVTTIGNYAFYDCNKLTSVTILDSVTTIGDYAFSNCSSLTSITIPDSVTTIGNHAFYECSSLTSVTIGDSVTTIGEWAFYYCNKLTSVTIPNSVTSIGDSAFYECRSLTSVTIGDSVTTIGSAVFRYCSSLTSVTIPDSVTTIGWDAFFYCTSLTSVTIGDSVTTIGDDAFYNCSSLQEFNGKFASKDGRCLIVDGTLNSFAPAGLTEYTIPDSVTTIGDGAFGHCNSLTSVTIPNSVTTIGDDAFYNCSSLTSVTIGDSVTTIGGSAFWYCSSLKKVYCNATIPPSLGNHAFNNNANGRRIYVYEECVEFYKSAWSSYKDSIYTNGQNCPDTTTIEYTTTDGNTITSSKLPIISNSYDNSVGTLVVVGKITRIPKDAFRDCDSLTSVTIPDSVTTIEDSAFFKCSNLTSVTIPDSVTTIGIYAFYYCTSLTSVTIGDSVTTIGNNAFQSCGSLTSVTIGDSVTSIGDAAFSGCKSLTSITIPDSVTTIGGSVFAYCSSLTSVYCKPTTPPAGGSSKFFYTASGLKIYVPVGSVEAYKSATNWSKYASDIVGYNF